MANKDELIEQAVSLGLTLTGEETKPELEQMIETANGNNFDASLKSASKTEEQMVPLSMVKQLIAEAIQNQAEKDKPVKIKKVTEHRAHVHRLNNKWVIDFADRNYDYENKKVKDPYIKEKIHAFQKFNNEKREYEAWLTLVYDDGSQEEIPLNRYVQRRTSVYCLIKKREKMDKSYSVGEVEKKKEVGDKNVGTGIMIEQDVEMYEETFQVETPDGKVLSLPYYVLA